MYSGQRRKTPISTWSPYRHVAVMARSCCNIITTFFWPFCSSSEKKQDSQRRTASVSTQYRTDMLLSWPECKYRAELAFLKELNAMQHVQLQSFKLNARNVCIWVLAMLPRQCEGRKRNLHFSKIKECQLSLQQALGETPETCQGQSHLPDKKYSIFNFH